MAAPTKPTDIKGGLNLVTPPMKRRGGGLQAVQNFRNDQDGGISRIDGYERFDGQAGSADAVYWNIPFDKGSVAPEIGQDLVGGTSNTTAVVLSFIVTSGAWTTCDAAGVIYAVSKNGDFLDNETIDAASKGGFSTGFSSGFEQGISPNSNCLPSNYFAIGLETTPFVEIHELSGFTKITGPASLPPGEVKYVEFSPDQTMLVCAHSVTPFITIYETATWTKLASPPSTGATLNASSVAFSSDGAMMAVRDDAALTIYNSTDVNPANWTAITTGITIKPGSSFIYRMAFGKNDTLFAAPDILTPFVHVWNTSDWSKVPAFSSPVLDSGWDVDFSRDGSVLAVSHENSPSGGGTIQGLSLFDTSDWSRITTPAAVQSKSITAMAFKKTEDVLAVAYRGSSVNVLEFYNTSTWAQIAGTGLNPQGTETPFHIAYAKNDLYIGYTYFQDTYMTGGSDYAMAPASNKITPPTPDETGCAFD